MSRIANLHKLQKIDSELDARKQRIAEIEMLLSQDQAVQNALTAWQATDQALTQARRQLRLCEDEVASTESKRAAAEQRLYSGVVKNPKEMQDLQELGVVLKKRLIQLEDQQLEAILNQESAAAQEQTARITLQGVQNDFASKSAQWRAEKEQLLTEQHKLLRERIVAEIPISASDRDIYQKLRLSKRGMAVSLVQDGTCRTCGMALSANRQKDARTSGELVYCGNCGRLVYIP
jgi:predicted  nucleic acid-binding Zn-ribbon protein